MSFPGAGFHTRNRDEQDVEEELDVEGDDRAIYGEAQFTEGDILLIHTEQEERFDDDFQVNVEDDERTGSLSELDGIDSAARDRGDTAGLHAAIQGSKSTPALICRICLDPYTEPTVSTGCWHTCCRECWLKCLDSTKLCPICKRITCATDLRRIYL